jgi:four helix bundle protein
MLDAADRATDHVNALLDGRSGRRILYAAQLRRSAQAVGSNISEAFGRGTDRDRARVLVIARAEAEETIRHLASNFRSSRITPKQYWPIHNLEVVVIKMLNSFLNH